MTTMFGSGREWVEIGRLGRCMYDVVVWKKWGAGYWLVGCLGEVLGNGWGGGGAGGGVELVWSWGWSWGWSWWSWGLVHS